MAMVPPVDAPGVAVNVVDCPGCKLVSGDATNPIVGKVRTVSMPALEGEGVVHIAFDNWARHLLLFIDVVIPFKVNIDEVAPAMAV